MKEQIKELLQQSVDTLKKTGKVSSQLHPKILIEEARDKQFGDFACNIAMIMAKSMQMNPRDIAELIVANLPASAIVKKIEIAGPGFINFTLVENVLSQVISAVFTAGEYYGHSKKYLGKRIHLEFVSANPTGPLHVGHGRSAAYGACVANLLSAVGADVHREYYVNDAGRQMHILALSIWLRYLELLGEKIELPENAYLGEYVIEIAKQLRTKYANRFYKGYKNIQKLLSEANITESDEKKYREKYLDGFVKIAIDLLSETDFEIIRNAGIDNILSDIQDDLEEFGVIYDEWFRESKLQKLGLIDEGIKLLKEHGYVYQEEGATWFRSTKFGDEKDRVLIRENGQPTYFAADVAHHLFVYQQGYDQVIDIFGADHHGYIARIQAFLRGLGENPKKLRVLLVQFAILYRGKEKVSMSTRKGSFVTLRSLRDEVGNDAARFFYIMRKPEQHLDFDLELAKSQSSDNPVYYIQYAHARICSVWRQLAQAKWQWDKEDGLNNLSLLNLSHEKDLFSSLNRFPELVLKAAENYAPHMIAHFLQEFANSFHTYYNASKFLVDDDHLRNARLALIASVQQVLANGLRLLGLSAPESM